MSISVRYLGSVDGIPAGFGRVVTPREVVEMADEMAEGHLRGSMWEREDGQAVGNDGKLLAEGEVKGDEPHEAVESSGQLSAAIARGGRMRRVEAAVDTDATLAAAVAAGGGAASNEEAKS